MNFGIDDDDPDFSLTPGARSRLSSLFQAQERTNEDPNQALMYTAPKQPKKQDQTASAPGQLKLIHAVAVHTYVLETGKYASQGQAGAAILGNHETLEYKLLLYKGKQQRITCCAINANFSYRVQEQNYANFYDDRKVNWSIMFDSEKSSIEFAKQIALAKANSCGCNLNSTIIQDLTAGEGSVVLENGGSAEIHFVGWIFSNQIFGDVFDSNMDAERPLRLRMGKSKVIKGWSGLLGSKKGTKRLVIIPPAFAYGSEGIPDRVPPNAVVIFEFHIKKVKEAKDSPSLSQSPAKVDSDFTDKKPEISPKPHSQSISDETIRMRGASISEQLMQSPKKGNATIISRMAKMGTATLPLPGAVAAQLSSESEAEEEYLSKSDPPTPPVPVARSRESSPKPVPKPRSSSGSAVVTHSVHPMPAHGIISQAHISQVSSSQQLPVYATASVPSHQHHVSDTFPLHMYPQATSHTAFPIMQPAYATHSLPAMSPTVVPSMTDSHLTLLLTETRSQNTEVRLSLSKISDKVETVLHKVEGIRSHEGSQSHSSLHYMESNVLVQNIQRIVQENTRLKEEVETKNSKIQSLNEKICDLLQKSQRFFEESNTYLEQRTESSLTQSRIFTLEQEKAKLSTDIQNALSKVSALETDLEVSRKMENELSEKLKSSKAECNLQQELVDSLKIQCSEKGNVMSSLQRNLEEVEHQKTELLAKVHHLGQKLNNDLELMKETLENTISRKEEEIKEIKAKSESHLIDIKDSHKERESAASDRDDTLRQALWDKEDLQNKMKELQSRYELLHEKSAKQKERFDNQVIELRNRMRQQLAQVSKAEVQPKASGSESDFDIKKTMNILYRLLQANIEVSASYGGEEVLKICLETIRGLTVRVLSQKQKFQSAPNLENSDDSATHSTSVEGQRLDSTLLAVSPPKNSSSVDSQSSEDQRPQSSPPTASPRKLNTTIDSCGETVDTGEPVSKVSASVSDLEETMNPGENSPLRGTESEGSASEVKSECINSELPSEREDSQDYEISQVTESSQVRVEVEEAKLDLKVEPQASSDIVLQNGENKMNLEVQQESTEDRKTPDQQSDALFVSEHKTEADDTSKASDLPNGPLKVL